MALAAVLAGCAVRPLDLPLPGTQMSVPTYTVKVEFGSVLNLPLRTRVELNGAVVGMVQEVDVRADPNASVPSLGPDKQPYYLAVATLQIDKKVELAAETMVEVRQHTLFGDSFIGLTSPEKPSGRTLSDGDTIPITQTRPADALEDYMTAVVGWVNGGSIPFIQDFLGDVNKAFPENPADLEEFLRKSTVTVHRIAESNDQLSRMLDNAGQVLDIAGQADDLWRFVFGDVPVLMETVERVLPEIVKFLAGIRDLAAWGAQVGEARAKSVNDVLGVWTPILQSIIMSPNTIPKNMAAMDALLRNKIGPFLSANGRPNIIVSDVVPQTPASALTGDPAKDARIVAANEQAFRDKVTPVLRMLGFIR
jgi:phospholipid/cholesterol/gamma-HCH transport system substrate-binding protein